MFRFNRVRVWAAACLVSCLMVAVPSASVSAAAGGSFVGSAIAPGTSGYWLVTAAGRVSAFGGAVSQGDMAGTTLNRPVIAMAATVSGNGYWLVAADGGIFAFGDARFFGSTGALKLNSPVIAMAATVSGNGYWLVAADGGIFAFGDARFFGSTGALKLNSPVVGMTATVSGNGYWLVAADGGIFAFGDARFFGSTGGMKLNSRVVAMASTLSGNGYWLAASDGGVFAFGDASFRGSGAGTVTGEIIAFIPDATGGYVIVDSSGAVLRYAGPVTAPGVVSADAGLNIAIPALPIATTPTTVAPVTTAAGSNGNLNGWKFIFGDDFNVNTTSGQFLSTYKNWAAYDTGWSDTSGRGIYDNSILSTSNGVLNMNLHTGPDGKPRSAVPIPLINGRTAADPADQLYGRYEVRYKADQLPGYKTAFLLWPKSETWPRDGEIDFPEGSLNGNLSAYTHHQGGANGGDQDAFETRIPNFGVWHTATVEWSPAAVRYLIDGNVIGTSTTRIPNTPMHWALQTETCLGSCTVPASSNGNLQIDYVKVWAYSPSTVAG